MCPFRVLGTSGEFFHFDSILHRNSWKQTVEILIRHHIWRRLNWVCTVCIITQIGIQSIKGETDYLIIKILSVNFNIGSSITLNGSLSLAIM